MYMFFLGYALFGVIPVILTRGNTQTLLLILQILALILGILMEGQ